MTVKDKKMVVCLNCIYSNNFINMIYEKPKYSHCKKYKGNNFTILKAMDCKYFKISGGNYEM